MKIGPLFGLLPLGLAACGAVPEEPTTIPEEPEPLRTTSQLSIYELNGTFREALATGSSLVILTRSGDVLITHSLNDFQFSEAYITAGGFNAVSPIQIDRFRMHGGVLAEPPFEYNPNIYFTLADRLDEEGGATDVFLAQLKDVYSTPTDAKVVLFNTEHDSDTTLDFATTMVWEIDFPGYDTFDPFQMFGASTLADRRFAETRLDGSGTAVFSGKLIGLYRPNGSTSQVVEGVLTLDVDFSGSTSASGSVTSLATDYGSLQDILLLGTVPSSMPGDQGGPFTGVAVTQDYNPDTGAASMTGKYNLLFYAKPTPAHDGPSDYVAGNIAIEGYGDELAGGLIAAR